MRRNISSLRRFILKIKIPFLFSLIILFTVYSMGQDFSHELYFVQITDTHYNEPGSKQRIKKIINAVNQLPVKIECVIHTGDITQEKLEVDSVVSNSLKLFSGFNVPFHILPGNHDILWNNFDKTKKSYIRNFDNLTTYQEYKGVVFLLIYTEPLAQSFSDSSYNPFAELQSGLKRAAGKPVLVFHHTPSVKDFYRNKMHEGWKKETSEKWIELLNEHNVKAVIAGHFHRDEHHWLGNVPLYVSGPVSGYWDRQATFRIYHYKDGKVGYRTQYIQ